MRFLTISEISLPSLEVNLKRVVRTSFVDSGCSLQVVHVKCIKPPVSKSQKSITTLGGAVHVFRENEVYLYVYGIQRALKLLVLSD